jgi:alkylation response protein AidB-like acyl-CoA dehydrogenase
MEAVESVQATLEAGAAESEETATLALASVDALYESGLFRLKMPHVLGGAEADLVTQLDVLEAVSRIDPASGWCLMIGAASMGSLAAFLPDEAIEEIFVGGKPPKVAGAFAPYGTATPVDGGYRLTGRWPFGSGVRHAEWVSAGAR